MDQALALIAEAKRTRATTLDLGNCGLTELPDLSGLPWLEELILSNWWEEYDLEKDEWTDQKSQNIGVFNSIVSLTGIEGLSALKKLIIAQQTYLSDLTPLKDLRQLHTINCFGTQVSDLAPLKNLEQLQTIHCSGTQVSDLTPLKDLQQLQTIHFFGTQVSDLTPLKDLRQLRTIHCFSTQVSDLTPLKDLRQLLIIDCSATQISDLEPLKDLKKLQAIDCSSTQVNDLEPLKNLIQLQTIDCSYTQISDLDPLKNLIQLQVFYCFDTQVRDLAPLKNLIQLQRINFSSTQVSDLEPLKDLKQLERIYISSTQVSDLTPIKDLNQLQKIDCSGTQISDLAPLKDLQWLQWIDCSYTQVSDLEVLRNVEQLQMVDCSSTQVSDLTPLLPLIEKGISVKWSTYNEENKIYIKDCPLDKALIAAIKKGQKAVLRYFQQPKVPLYEARVLVLGEPRAGKTTLRRKLKNVNYPMPTLQESTKAFEIEIEPYKCKIEKEGEQQNMTYHLWDFGGQDYYRLLHQLFVAEQSVYVIVTDTDRNKNEEEIDFWLETIHRLGRDKNGRYGPVLLLQNPKTNREGSDFLDLKKRYPFWQQDERFVINLNALSKGENFDKIALEQFNRFKTTLERSFCQLDHVGKQMPADWVKVRKALVPYEKENWITTEQFHTICIKKGIREDDIADLLDIFHTLGYVLHYKNTALQGMVVLKREWVTDALYRVLDDATVQKNGGWFRLEDAKKIWFEPRYENRTSELLALMQEFKLSYLNEGNQKYIVPAKLSEDPENLPGWDNGQNVSLHLQYDWLPRAIPIQLIVTLHDNLVELENGEQWIWRRGAVIDGRKLDLKNVQVQILENWREHKIEIRAKGKHSEVLIRTVMAAWRKVHEPFEDKVTVHKQILCACSVCQQAKRPFVFEYEDVLNAVEAGDDLRCNKSRDDFSASSILQGLFDVSTVTMDIYEKHGKEISSELYELISANKLSEALKILSENGDNQWTLDLKRRYTILENTKIKNIISPEEYNQEKSKIVSGILKYADNRRRKNMIFNEDNITTPKIDLLQELSKLSLEFSPTINFSIQNQNINTPQSNSSMAKDIEEIKAMLTQLNTEIQTKLKDFIETLPEPENTAEKESTGRQILKWLDKNAEGITTNVAASVYYDILKGLLGI